nr:hypothetical protein CFP56_09888 [Quercus suber]
MAAYPNPRSGYHQQPQNQQSHRPKPQDLTQHNHNQHHPLPDHPSSAFFADDDDDAGVLDPSVLDADLTQSPTCAAGEDSLLAMHHSVLSPVKSQGWESQQQQHHQFVGDNNLSIDTTGSSQIPYHGDQISPFPPQSGQPAPSFANAPQQWRYGQPNGDGTSTGGVNFMSHHPPLDGNQYQHHRQDSVHGSFSHVGPSFPTAHHRDSTYDLQAPQVQTPMSPHSHQDWMGMAQREMEARPMQKRVRPNSPSTLLDLARQDGIRKKNNRIDIPSERTLGNIDNMIENAPDEETIKELKQQKRLLRNPDLDRLASRQRKKKHTEDLEVKEKGYTQQIHMLEQDRLALANDLDRRQEDQQVLLRSLDEAHRANEMLQEQMRHMQTQHNEETSILRKRINILTEHLEAPVMSAAPSSTGFTEFNAEMEALNMESQDWDQFLFSNELPGDQQHDYHLDLRSDQTHHQHQPASTLEKKASAATIVPAPKKTKEGTTDPPIASSLLFMLLLCGAFVASKPPGSQPRDMIKMPDHVIAAAPAILNQLMSETGDLQDAHGMTQQPQAPLASHPSHITPRSNLARSDAEPMSRLDQMHSRLLSPTKQQEIDEAFALTPSRWASIANIDFPAAEASGSSHHDTTRPRRRNLAAALQEMYPEQNSKAEVYTRSLLWEQIPADVVQQFKQMVRDHAEIEGRQSNERQNDGSVAYGYKVEH